MTDKHIPASKLLALINEYYDSVHDLPQAIRALIDEAPEVEIFGYVSDTTYSVTDAGTVRKTPNDIFKNPVFVEPPPSPDLTKLAGDLAEALEELEWDGWEYDKGGEGFSKCPSCGNAQHGTNCHHAGEIGHKNDCSLNNALTRAKEYLK